MKKKISLVALSAILVAGTAMASGYRIPEQSVNSTAKAGANIASATGADSSYFNPANMAWTDDDKWQFEGGLQYINLPVVHYADNRSTFMYGDSKAENFFIPTFFLVSPDMYNLRFGISLTAPYGLSKRWEQPFPRATAEEYSLTVLEMNPTISYEILDMISLSGGVRMVYGDATVSSYAMTADESIFSRKMEGDTYQWGYNLAASIRPVEEMNITITYRSHVDLDFEGDVTLATNVPAPYSMDTGGNVSIPAPAVFSVSMAYTFGPATIDLTWDKTFWSEYESIAFGYDQPITNPTLDMIFSPAVPKNWADSSAYRIGLDYKVSEQASVMAGFAYDETPVPESTLGFELPDSDAFLYSIGTRLQLNDKMTLGLAYLYDFKKSRTVVNGTPDEGINGEFTDSRAHLFNIGLSYDF